MRSSDWKLGAFVLLSIVGGFAALVWLGGARRDETTDLVTYFDETVQGLEVGAPVKLRGVPIGSVAAIGFAPDRRHVEVTLAVSVDRLRLLGLVDDHRRPQAPDGLRAQLASSGITGFKFVNIEVPRDPPPPPRLDFAPPRRYVPSRPSSFAGLEQGVTELLARAPAITERLTLLLDRLTATLDAADLPAVGAQAREALAEAKKTAAAATSAAASVDQAAQRLDHALREAGPVLGRTQATLDDVGDAARALRRLADALERDPDMLLHGRAK